MSETVMLWINQGSHFVHDFDVLDIDGVAPDISEYEIFAQIKKHPSTSKFKEFLITKDVSNNKFSISLPDSVSWRWNQEGIFMTSFS